MYVFLLRNIKIFVRTCVLQRNIFSTAMPVILFQANNVRLLQLSGGCSYFFFGLTLLGGRS